MASTIPGCLSSDDRPVAATVRNQTKVGYEEYSIHDRAIVTGSGCTAARGVCGGYRGQTLAIEKKSLTRPIDGIIVEALTAGIREMIHCVDRNASRDHTSSM